MSGKTHTTSLCQHNGDRVKIGEYVILAGGLRYLQPENFEGVDVLIPLDSKNMIPLEVGQMVQVMACPWPDFSPPPDGFKWLLEERVIPFLREGKTVLVFCIGGHGRTGTFLASLLAILEPEIADPIAEIRARYCVHAVETAKQAQSVFALVGKDVPEMYQ